MSMAFADLFRSAINIAGERTLFQLALPIAESHGAAHFVDTDKVAQFKDDRKRSLLVELGRVRIAQAAGVPRKLDAGRLHAETDAKVRRLGFARVLDRAKHPGDAAFAKAAGNENRVKILQ